MSKAFKCDVCQKCFSPVDFDEEQCFAFVNEIMIKTKSDYQRGVRGMVHGEFHFCPECTTKLSKFLQGEEIKNDASTCEDADQIINEIGSYDFGNLCRLAAAFEREVGRRIRNSVQYDGSCVFEGPGEAPQRKKRAEKNGE